MHVLLVPSTVDFILAVVESGTAGLYELSPMLRASQVSRCSAAVIWGWRHQVFHWLHSQLPGAVPKVPFLTLAVPP